MPHADSANLRAIRPSSWPPGRINKASAAKVFDSELFETYVARIVRKHLVSQYVDSDHPVLLDELRLIGESAERLRDHLAATVPSWNLNWRVSKMVVIQHLRRMAEERLSLHDVDDESREEALERVYREDFEHLWPQGWLDS